MQVSVEKVSNIECRLTIVVPASLVEETYQKKINQIAKTAKNVNGFRPGKAPRDLIQKRYGIDARSDALSEVMQQSLYQAIAQENLRPVSTPQVEPKAILPNQPFEFIASFEVLPEIESVNFSIDKVEKPVVEVNDDDVKRVIDQLLKQHAKWSPVENRPAQLGDRVVIDYYAIFEGVSDIDNKIHNFPLELGSKVMMPGFEDGLVGATHTEERKLNLNFPADVAVPEKAGKPVEFIVNVKQIYHAEIPVLNESFVQKLGVKSGEQEDLKKQIKQSLEQEKDRLVREKVKEQIFGRLIEQNPIEVPKSLVAREAKSIHDEIYAHDQHHEHNHSDDEMNSFNDIAKKRVALGLLIAEFAKRNDLMADLAKVDQRIEEIASVYENPAEVVAWLSSAERRGGIEAQVLEDQVMDKLLDGVNVIPKPMSYAEIKGIRI